MELQAIIFVIVILCFILLHSPECSALKTKHTSGNEKMKNVLYIHRRWLSETAFWWWHVRHWIITHDGLSYRLKDETNGIIFGKKHQTWVWTFSAWNRCFASAGHRVRQSALRASHSQFVSVFCIWWYTIEIRKPAGHCDQQKTNPVGYTWNRAEQWPMTGNYFMHCVQIIFGEDYLISIPCV